MLVESWVHLRVSPIKVAPKKTLGEFRFIHNLTYPYDEKAVNTYHVIGFQFNIPPWTRLFLTLKKWEWALIWQRLTLSRRSG